MNFIHSCFVGMLNRAPSGALIPLFDEQPNIPKLIHQVFFPKRILPAELQSNINSIRALNPNWQHVLYDDVDIMKFIRSAYGDDIYRRFERINPLYGAARADLFRYLLLYKLGGVYLDVKSAATRPLDDALRPNDRFVISQWPDGPEAKLKGAGWHEETRHVLHGEFQQWFIVSAPGHPFLKAVIENVLQNITVYNPFLHGVGKKGVLRVTGPIAYTLAIEPMLTNHPHRFADAESDLGFDYSIYPTVDKGDHAHIRLFKTHYSESKTSLVRLNTVEALATTPLLFLERMVRRVLRKTPSPP